MNTEEDIAAQQRIEAQQIRQDAETFQSLLKHPGWTRYLALVEKVGNNYHQQMLRPLENSFECVKTEFAKGALTGLSLAAQLPSSKIKEAQELKRPTDTEE
jgi:hypothetical protein